MVTDPNSRVCCLLRVLRTSAVADSQLAQDLHRERERIHRQILAQQQTLRALDEVIDTAELIPQSPGSATPI